MKQPLLLLILAGLTFIYFFDPVALNSPVAKTVSAEPRRNAVVVIAPAPSSYNRWKTGPTAQNEWKTGPNAQTNFEPFAPNEQANWNQSSGYTIISGARIRR